MAAQYKTRCPHCQAQFRIGEEHLRQAKGQVRCGSCLKVFLATENLVGGPSADKTGTPGAPAKRRAAAEPARPPEGSPETWQMPDEERQQDTGSRWTLGDEADTPKPPEPSSPDTSADNDEKNDTRLNLGGLELSDSFLSIDRDDDDQRLRDDDFSDLAGVASGGSSSTTDESWAEQLLEELEDEPDAQPQPVEAPRPEPADSSALETRSGKRASPSRGKHHPRAMRERDEWMQDIEPEPEPFGTDAESLLDSLPEEDLSVLDLDRERGSSSRNDVGEIIRWSFASLALLILLGVQYMIFEFEDLARRPALRPTYAALCERLPCELPPLIDVRSLRASNLVVRPHPDASGALMVDLLLHNDGAYAQPWPDLELGFTSLEGSPVASRRFSPAEYLKGDLASVDRMPVETPVHVSLEIIDPGERAVNYTLRPLPPRDNRG